jgi:hypothetical protein
MTAPIRGPRMASLGAESASLGGDEAGRLGLRDGVVTRASFMVDLPKGLAPLLFPEKRFFPSQEKTLY